MNWLDHLRTIARRSPLARSAYRKLKDWRLHAESAYYDRTEIGHDHPVRSNTLKPLGSVTTCKEFVHLLECPAFEQIRQIEEKILEQVRSEAFTVNGFCAPCDRTVPFLVDMCSGGQRLTHGWMPNWRERLECPLCRMNNRQRLVATLVKQALSLGEAKQIYFMEQIAPVFDWAVATFNQHRLIGSEYLGHDYTGGITEKGVRHEDIEHLSFADEQFDLIVSNDVFEHVPNPADAFVECVRVLKPGGILLATIPFHRECDTSVSRARLINGCPEHILPPVYHGNPLSEDGSLVFTDFGWDLLDLMKDAGFSDVAVEVYASPEYGHLGGGQLVFRARTPLKAAPHSMASS